jgi:hypothetical protein
MMEKPASEMTEDEIRKTFGISDMDSLKSGEKKRQAWIIGLGIVLAWAFGFAWAAILKVGCTA